MGGRLEQLELGGRLVKVVPYPAVAKVSEIKYALGYSHQSCDPNEITTSQLQKMQAISNFISSSDHFPITEYTSSYHLCGKQGCIFCAKIGLGIRMTDISIKGNIFEENYCGGLIYQCLTLFTRLISPPRQILLGHPSL